MQSPTPSQSVSRNAIPIKRRRKMCHQCRKDKQKCNPLNRDWDVEQQKCDRCILLDHPCGPSVTAERKPRKRRATTNVDNIQLSEGSPSDDSSTVEHSRPRNDPPSRPVVAWAGSGTAVTDPDRGVANVGPAMLALSSLHDSLDEGKKLLARLEDNLATMELFRLELHCCENISVWTGHDDVSSRKTVIQSTFYGLKENLERCFRQARRLAEENLGPVEVRHRFLQHLYYLESKSTNALHQDLTTPPRHRHDCNPSEIDSALRTKHWLYSIQRKTGPCSPLHYLYGDIFSKLWSGPCVHHGSDCEIVEDHFTASQTVTEVLAEIPFQDVSTRDAVLGLHQNQRPLEGSGLPLPPCHLGARQDNPNVLLKLWQKSRSGWERDFLHRTPVHVGAYFGNLSAFHRVFETESHAVIHAGPDCFGFSPLMITACRDDLEGFILLLKHGASDRELYGNKSILALAAYNGSKKVVQHMLAESRPLQFSPRSELREALLAGHHDVAQIFIDHFRSQPFAVDNHVQIMSAIPTAQNLGFQDIATQLERLNPSPPSIQGAIDTCDNLDYWQHYLWNYLNCRLPSNLDPDMAATFPQMTGDQIDDLRITQDGPVSSPSYPEMTQHFGSSHGLWDITSMPMT